MTEINPITEINSMNLEKAKKTFDEHKNLHKLLSDENLENTSLLFFDPKFNFDPYTNSGMTCSKVFINFVKEEEKYNNKLYLPGIKIENNKVFTEQELGKTMTNEIHNKDIMVSFYNPKSYIYKLYKMDSCDIPQEILDSIKQIELLEVQIVEEKNKILNSNYVKDKLNYKFDNINEHKNLLKCLDELTNKNLI